MKNKMKVQKPGKYVLFNLIFLLALSFIIISIWFRKGMMIGYAEVGFPFYNMLRLFNIAKYLWWSLDAGGTYPTTITSIPFFFFFAILQKFGMSSMAQQATLFFLITLLNGLSMYYLVSFLMKDKNRYMVSLLASLFYMLNPFIMINVWHRFLYTGILIMPLLPLILALYIRGLEKKKISYAFLICLVSLLFSYAFGTPGYIIVSWLILFSYFIFFIFLNKRNKAEVIYATKFSITLFILWLLLNTWWILPMKGTGPSAISKVALVDNIGSFKGVSQYFTLPYDLRGINSFYMFIESDWGPIYSSFLFQMISFMIPILVFSAILFNPKNRWVLYFTCLSLLGLFLAKGSSPPFGGISVWLLVHFPMLAIFRNPYERFGVIIPLSYAFLFGMGLCSLYGKAKRKLPNKRNIAQTLIVTICFLTMGLYLWPMWTGKVFDSARYGSNYIEVPSYYGEADRWLSNQVGDFRIIHLPFSPEVGITYNWKHGYSGVEPSMLLFARPSFSRKTWIKHVDDIVQRLPKLLDSNHLKNFMGLLNIKYIVLHHEVDYEAREIDSPGKIEKALSKVKYIHLVKNVGQLDLYQISDQYFLPHIFASSRATLLEGGMDALVSLSSTRYLGNRPCLLFLEQMALCNQEDLVSKADTLVTYKEGELSIRPIVQFKKETSFSQVSFRKINPTKYEIEVKEEEPFWLVFSETYHPGWKAYVRQLPVTSNQLPVEWSALVSAWKDRGKRKEIKEHFIANGYANGWYISVSPSARQFEWSALVSAWRDRGERIELKEHFMVNGYANGWFVPTGQFTVDSLQFTEKEQNEEFEIVLEFVPQRLLEAGVAISGISLLCCLGCLATIGLKARKRRREQAQE